MKLETSKPVIGITTDRTDSAGSPGTTPTYKSAVAYSSAIVLAGGVPILLTHEIDLIPHYLGICQGFLITGGGDPRMEQFGRLTHPKASLMSPARQAFDIALIRAIDATNAPTLGICLGMQLMSLAAGGDLNQHLPDTLGDAALVHQKDQRHAVTIADESLTTVLAPGPVPLTNETVVSWHHQAVSDAGKLRVAARASDGVIEAVVNPQKPFYLGVQWHPERGGEGPLNQGLIDSFVDACRRAI